MQKYKPRGATEMYSVVEYDIGVSWRIYVVLANLALLMKIIDSSLFNMEG